MSERFVAWVTPGTVTRWRVVECDENGIDVVPVAQAVVFSATRVASVRILGWLYDRAEARDTSG